MWSYNSFYDDPNNVLAHSFHKYIDKYEKNGKTVYVYDGEYVANHPLTSVNKKTLSGNSTLRKYGPLKTRAQRQKDKQYYDSSRVANAAKQAEKERIAKSTPKKQLDRDAALKKIGSLLEERNKATLDPDRRNAQSSREAAIQESAKKVQQQNRQSQIQNAAKQAELERKNASRKDSVENAQNSREKQINKSVETVKENIINNAVESALVGIKSGDYSFTVPGSYFYDDHLEYFTKEEKQKIALKIYKRMKDDPGMKQTTLESAKDFLKRQMNIEVK